MFACRASSSARTPRDERAHLGLRRRADDAALRRDEPRGQRILERRQAAPLEQSVVAVDLGDAAPFCADTA